MQGMGFFFAFFTRHSRDNPFFWPWDLGCFNLVVNLEVTAVLLLSGLKNLEWGTVRLYTVPNVQNSSIYGDDFFSRTVWTFLHAKVYFVAQSWMVIKTLELPNYIKTSPKINWADFKHKDYGSLVLILLNLNIDTLCM